MTRASVMGRRCVTWAALLVAIVVVMVAAASLEPSPDGHGTHTQLGLPPCGVLLLTGLRCPGCGLTTAFSHMARFELLDAFVANPLGVVLFIVLVALAPVSVLAISRGWTVRSVLQRPVAYRLATLVLATAVFTWALRTVNDLTG